MFVQKTNQFDTVVTKTFAIDTETGYHTEHRVMVTARIKSDKKYTTSSRPVSAGRRVTHWYSITFQHVEHHDPSAFAF